MVSSIHAQRILILDFGSQYTQLIARRVRDLGIYCEILDCHVTEQAVRDFAPTGIILSGGPESVTEETTARAPEVVFQMNCPVLGICYGMQTMAVQLGGTVEKSLLREFGYAEVSVHGSSRLLQGIEDRIHEDGTPVLDVWMSHGDHVATLPPSFSLIASTAHCPIIGMADEQRHFYGLQFHPEVSHSHQGMRMLERFVLDICQCKPVWTAHNILEDAIANIREQVGDEHVILGLSGGVDSSVLAALLHKAIGHQLTCVFVDNGLLRLHEREEVQALFAKHLGIHLVTVDAEKMFLDALKGKEDPEEKRKIIGKLFIDVFDAEAKKLPAVKWLAQGTIYSDVIESAATGTGIAHVIKSHHNVGALPENMSLKLLEPLRELFKDEVRNLGIELGLPAELIHRHPFPGPGLAVRIIGEVRKEYADKLRAADNILMQELRQNNWYDKLGQAFMVFLPVKSVAVLGDARCYDHVLAIRAVETDDFMTAHAARLPYELLEKISNRIINEVHGISRVVYDISSKPPATIEWE